jgi:hypothetical protein
MTAILIRALTYATLFISLVLVYLPVQMYVDPMNI